MPPPEFSEKALVEALRPLGPYLDHAVVCGSWTLFIYRRWVLKQPSAVPVRTLDVDLAVPSRLRIVDAPVEKVLKEAGFKEDFESDATPPVTRFKLKGTPYLEFVTPHKGNTEQGTREVQAGLAAQELRYLEIIVGDSLEVPIPAIGRSVRVATPAAYLFQKGLSFVRRMRHEKKARDLGYLFDLLHNLPEMRRSALRRLPLLVGRHGASWYAAFRRNIARYFPPEYGEGIDMVVSQKPAPYSDIVLGDPTNGPRRFRELVHRTFADLQEDLRS